MKYRKDILATTRLDLHNERFALEALEDMVEQVKAKHIPLIIEHDPRVPPFGRMSHGEVQQLEDEEYAFVVTFEIFEAGDQIELIEEARSLPTRNVPLGDFLVTYDRNFRNEEDQELLNEVANLLKTEPLEEGKKAFDPLSVLTIGGAFIAGGIAAGFLHAVGSDAYILLKAKVKELMLRRKRGEKEKLFKFHSTVYVDDRSVDVEAILTNPTADDIDTFFAEGLNELDQILPPYLQDKNARRIVLEFQEKRLEVKFGVRRDAVPMFPKRPKKEK